MSLDHIKTMLETLKQYTNCEITLTFKNKNGIPLLSVCYDNNCYELTHLDTQIIETCDDIESTISAIDKVMQDSSKKTSN
ncbi:hypothetical protein ASG99_26320 [Bacillus sp. Soil768D1]|nr:hypothetical protein ASG99_26320 [Bacillus sp. Soil768D1]